MKTLAVIALLTLSAAALSQEKYNEVEIEPENTSVPYNRSEWGSWWDADGDEETTRDEVLIEESLVTAGVFEQDGKRKVISGLWVGPLCGFVTNDPSTLDIDHLVPLEEVHQSGGWQWTEKRKKEYYNDLIHSHHLIATKAGCNRSKGSQDPAEWMPPNRTYWCNYIEQWILVKRRWRLSADQAEIDALKKGRKVCERYKAGDSLDGRH